MQYRYSGPLTALTLPDGQEVILTPGATVELPEDNPAIVTLVALGRLKSVPAKPAAKKTAQKGD
jgi:hypothetical protein